MRRACGAVERIDRRLVRVAAGKVADRGHAGRVGVGVGVWGEGRAVGVGDVVPVPVRSICVLGSRIVLVVALVRVAFSVVGCGGLVCVVLLVTSLVILLLLLGSVRVVLLLLGSVRVVLLSSGIFSWGVDRRARGVADVVIGGIHEVLIGWAEAVV